MAIMIVIALVAACCVLLWRLDYTRYERDIAQRNWEYSSDCLESAKAEWKEERNKLRYQKKVAEQELSVYREPAFREYQRLKSIFDDGE